MILCIEDFSCAALSCVRFLKTLDQRRPEVHRQNCTSLKLATPECVLLSRRKLHYISLAPAAVSGGHRFRGGAPGWGRKILLLWGPPLFGWVDTPQSFPWRRVLFSW